MASRAVERGHVRHVYDIFVELEEIRQKEIHEGDIAGPVTADQCKLSKEGEKLRMDEKEILAELEHRGVAADAQGKAVPDGGIVRPVKKQEKYYTEQQEEACNG